MKILRFYYTDTEEDIESIPCSRINSLLFDDSLVWRVRSFRKELARSFQITLKTL